MDGGTVLISSTFPSNPFLVRPLPPPSSFPVSRTNLSFNSFRKSTPSSSVVVCPRTSLQTLSIDVGADTSTDTDQSSSYSRPSVDDTGKLCTPRAARELALLIAYAACLEGSDPVRLFDKRVNARREPGYEFEKNALLGYNQLSFGGPPVRIDIVEEAEELLRNYDNESAIEAAVLSAPPKLVYSARVLSFARKLLVAVVHRWDNNVLIIDEIVPERWKKLPASRILELCILHMAMSEITELGTRYQIVINEAVDLAKRFCDGMAPRVINGCLRTFVRDLEKNLGG